MKYLKIIYRFIAVVFVNGVYADANPSFAGVALGRGDLEINGEIVNSIDAKVFAYSRGFTRWGFLFDLIKSFKVDDKNKLILGEYIGYINNNKGAISKDPVTPVKNYKTDISSTLMKCGLATTLFKLENFSIGFVVSIFLDNMNIKVINPEKTLDKVKPINDDYVAISVQSIKIGAKECFWALDTSYYRKLRKDLAYRTYFYCGASMPLNRMMLERKVIIREVEVMNNLDIVSVDTIDQVFFLNSTMHAGAIFSLYNKFNSAGIGLGVHFISKNVKGLNEFRMENSTSYGRILYICEYIFPRNFNSSKLLITLEIMIASK